MRWPVAITAEVQALPRGGYSMVIHDPSRALAVDGIAVLSLSCTGSSCTWQLESADQTSLAVTQVAQMLRGAAGTVQLSGGMISGLLQAEAVGTASLELVEVGLGLLGGWVGGSPVIGDRPLVAWNVALTRVGPATAAVPAARRDQQRTARARFRGAGGS